MPVLDGGKENVQQTLGMGGGGAVYSIKFKASRNSLVFSSRNIVSIIRVILHMNTTFSRVQGDLLA